MDEFNVFGDFSKLSDEAIMEQVSKLNSMIDYYYSTSYSYLVPQLQSWRDMRMDAMDERALKRKLDKNKGKESNVIFDNSSEVMNEVKEKENKEREEKEKLLNPKKK